MSSISRWDGDHHHHHRHHHVSLLLGLFLRPTVRGGLRHHILRQWPAGMLIGDWVADAPGGLGGIHRQAHSTRGRIRARKRLCREVPIPVPGCLRPSRVHCMDSQGRMILSCVLNPILLNTMLEGVVWFSKRFHFQYYCRLVSCIVVRIRLIFQLWYD